MISCPQTTAQAHSISTTVPAVCLLECDVDPHACTCHILQDTGNDMTTDQTSDPDDDVLDYINIREKGFPLLGAEITKKTKFAHLDPRAFDLVEGHVYDRPDIKSPTREESANLTAQDQQQQMTSDTSFHDEFEARRRDRLSRHTRVTHENVVIPRRSARTPPIPPPRQLGVASRAVERPTVVPRSNWPKQELDWKSTDRKVARRES